MSKKILFVDDDRVLMHLVGEYFSKYGYEVFVAADGEDGLKKCEEIAPDLLVLDVQMPKLNGYSFLFEIRKLEHCSKIPVIILTCREELEDIFRVEGVKEYLLKPVKNEELLEKIKKYI